MTLAFLSSLVQPFKCFSIIKPGSIIVFLFAAAVYNVQTLTTVTSSLHGTNTNQANGRNLKGGEVFLRQKWETVKKWNVSHFPLASRHWVIGSSSHFPKCRNYPGDALIGRIPTGLCSRVWPKKETGEQKNVRPASIIPDERSGDSLQDDKCSTVYSSPNIRSSRTVEDAAHATLASIAGSRFTSAFSLCSSQFCLFTLRFLACQQAMMQFLSVVYVLR